MPKTRQLPHGFAVYARPLAAANPRAYDSEADALYTLQRSYFQIIDDPDIESTATGGFMLKRDGDGFIELWIAPTVCWPEAKGESSL